MVVREDVGRVSARDADGAVRELHAAVGRRAGEIRWLVRPVVYQWDRELHLDDGDVGARGPECREANCRSSGR